MSEIKWIAIAVNMFDDEKIALIEAMPDADAILVIWLKMLTLAGKLNNGGVLMMANGMPYTDEMLSTLFRRPLNTVRLALSTYERYGMIEYIDNVISLPNWEKWQKVDSLDKVREQTRIRVARHRERQKALVDDVTLHNATVTQYNNNNKNNNKNNNVVVYDFNEELSAEEIQELYDTYEDAGALIDQVQTEVNRKHTVISKSAYAYIVGYAIKKGWCVKNG